MASYKVTSVMLSLLTALLAFSGAVAQSAPSAACSLTIIHNLIVEGRKQDVFIAETYSAYSNFMSNFKVIENRLVGTCDGLRDRRSKIQRFTQYLTPAKYIPPLKNFVVPVQNLGERLDVTVLKQPTETVCKVVTGIREQIDRTNTTMVGLQKAVTYFLEVTVNGYNKLETGLDLFVRLGGTENAQCPTLRGICHAARELVSAERVMASKARKVLQELDTMKRALASIDSKIKIPVNALQVIFKGPVDTIIGGVEKLFTTEVTLPIPRGSKDRGKGEIPSCCPSGWSRSGGLCYQNCRSGYATVALACVERCPSGWRDIGVACSKVTWKKKKKRGIKIKVPKTEVRRKGSYARLGRAPATFGGSACSCRSSKRYLEAGLCYNKCGRDQFVNYRTQFLTSCLDLRPTRLSILDLTKHLDIFEKAEKIPALKQALKGVDLIIKKAFAGLASFISKATGVVPPVIKVSSVLPRVDSLASLEKVINTGLAEALTKLANALGKDADCLN